MLDTTDNHLIPTGLPPDPDWITTRSRLDHHPIPTGSPPDPDWITTRSRLDHHSIPTGSGPLGKYNPNGTGVEPQRGGSSGSDGDSETETNSETETDSESVTVSEMWQTCEWLADSVQLFCEGFLSPN